MRRRCFLKAGALAAAVSPTSVLAADGVAENKKYYKITEADVVVVGAGPAGIPAAISAARNGSKVVLIEEDQLLGGAPVDMFVSFPCGGPQTLGIFSEIRKQLVGKYDISDGKPHALWFFPSSFAVVLMQMVKAEKNITLISGAPACGAIMDKNSPSKIIGVEYNAGENRIGAAMGKIVIDATGTGLVSVMAGAKFMYGREAKSDFGEKLALDKADDNVQPCTLMAYLQKFRNDATADISKLLKNDVFKKMLIARSGIGFAKKMPDDELKPVFQFLMWTAAKGCDTRDSVSIGNATAEIMNTVIPEFSDAFWKEGYALHVAPKLGVRECRRVIGDKIITCEELMKPEFPEDVISQGVYRIDSWGRKLPPDHLKSLSFGIPYFATVVKGIDNLMMAGKHISGTSLAMSAYRVQPVLAGIGQAVGLAASMSAAANSNPRDINIKDLQKRLAAQGMLPKKYS